MNIEKTETYQLQLFDNVLASFLETNVWRKRHYDFDDLLSIENGKYFFRFTHEFFYTAEVSITQAFDKDCLNIKLSNDRFTKLHVYDNVFSKMKTLTKKFLGKFPHGVFNFGDDTLYVRLYSDDASIKNVLISFQHGNSSSKSG